MRWETRLSQKYKRHYTAARGKRSCNAAREKVRIFPPKSIAEDKRKRLRRMREIASDQWAMRESARNRARSTSTYATVDPINHINGKNENALAILVSSVSSPMADFNTPTFPFNVPASALLQMMPMNVCESPKLVIESVSPSSPITSTGLRPIRSERRPHCKINTASVKKKRDS